MYLPLFSSSLFKYSLSIKDSILCLMRAGWATKLWICLVTSMRSSLWFSCFLAFMILTMVASVMFCLSILISLSSFFCSSTFSVVCFFEGIGIKLTLMLLFAKSGFGITVSVSSNLGLLGFCFINNLILGLHIKMRAGLSSYSWIWVICLISSKVTFSLELNKQSTHAWYTFTTSWYLFFVINTGVISTLPCW